MLVLSFHNKVSGNFSVEVLLAMPNIIRGTFVASHFVIPDALCNKLLSHFVITL